jgi:hypothetical protein
MYIKKHLGVLLARYLLTLPITLHCCMHDCLGFLGYHGMQGIAVRAFKYLVGLCCTYSDVSKAGWVYCFAESVQLCKQYSFESGMQGIDVCAFWGPCGQLLHVALVT